MMALTMRGPLGVTLALWAALTVFAAGPAIAQSEAAGPQPTTIKLGYSKGVDQSFKIAVNNLNSQVRGLVQVRATSYPQSNVGTITIWWNGKEKTYWAYLAGQSKKFTLYRNPDSIPSDPAIVSLTHSDGESLAGLVVVRALEDRASAAAMRKDVASANAVCEAQDLLMKNLKPKPKFTPKVCAEMATARKLALPKPKKKKKVG